MIKRQVLIPLIIAIAIVFLGILFFLFKPKDTISPVSSKAVHEANIVLEKEQSKSLKKYIGDSGFSFDYPEDINLAEKEIGDTLYANLELVSSQENAGITIKIADTKFSSIDDWILENNLEVSSSKGIIIGGLSGRELSIADKLIAVSIDQGVLFTIEVNSKNPYWLSVYNTLQSSFAFSQEKETEVFSPSSSDLSEEDVILEEEIVE